MCISYCKELYGEEKRRTLRFSGGGTSSAEMICYGYFPSIYKVSGHTS